MQEPSPDKDDTSQRRGDEVISQPPAFDPGEKIRRKATLNYIFILGNETGISGKLIHD